MTQTDLVLLEKDRGVTTVIFNRPEALNALSAALRNRALQRPSLSSLTTPKQRSSFSQAPVVRSQLASISRNSAEK